MKTSLTKELEKYTAFLEKQNQDSVSDPWRLKYHVMPPVGWLNDPNGLCFFNGKYHLFFQYSPSEATGSLKYWGHYTGTDMIHWDYEGIALYPDMPYDCDGVYSGSALVEDDCVWLYYTGNVKLSGDYDYIYTGREGNTVLAVMRADGTIGDKTLVMDNKDYPADLSCHVRDPKVWIEDGLYYMVLGARTKEDHGEVLLYVSEDRLHWTLKNIFTIPDFGYMWECPDMFVLDGQRFLSFSPQGIERDGLDFANIYQSGYCLLDGDFTGAASLGKFKEYDRGFDFYAPQTFLDRDGRRILIGWMGMPDCDYINPTVEKGWQHCMTVPRELTVKAGKIFQYPVRELEELRSGAVTKTQEQGESLDVRISSDVIIKIDDPENLHLCVDHDLHIVYKKADQIFKIEFAPGSPLGGGRTMRGVALESLEEIRILSDTSALEIYVNHGAEVFSTRFYPQIDGTGKDCHTIEFMEGSGFLTAWSLEEAN